jgi:hypothetical protein
LKKFWKYYRGGAPGAILSYIILFFAPTSPKNIEGIILLVKVNAIAFIVKESISFIMFEWWIFKKPSRKILKEMFSYFFVMASILILNILSFLALTMLFNINNVMSQIFINICFTYFNFLGTIKTFNGNGK